MIAPGVSCQCGAEFGSEKALRRHLSRGSVQHQRWASLEWTGAPRLADEPLPTLEAGAYRPIEDLPSITLPRPDRKAQQTNTMAILLTDWRLKRGVSRASLDDLLLRTSCFTESMWPKSSAHAERVAKEVSNVIRVTTWSVPAVSELSKSAHATCVKQIVGVQSAYRLLDFV
jgi:hypothetical protein